MNILVLERTSENYGKIKERETNSYKKKNDNEGNTVYFYNPSSYNVNETPTNIRSECNYWEKVLENVYKNVADIMFDRVYFHVYFLSESDKVIEALNNKYETGTVFLPYSLGSIVQEGEYPEVTRNYLLDTQKYLRSLMGE